MKHLKYSFYIFFPIGLWVMIYAKNLLTLYIGFELVGLCTYALVGFSRALLLYGIFSSAFFLLGLSFLYGISGSLTFSSIQTSLSSGFTDPFLLYFISLCILVAVVRQIMSMKDSAFLTSCLPIAGFVLLIRFFYGIFFDLPNFHWPKLLILFSILITTGSNLCAFRSYRKGNFRELLCYSAVSHTAWIFSGLAFSNAAGIQAACGYLIIFLLMNIGSFLALNYIPSIKGLGWRSPLMAFILSVFIATQMGLPPFSGFVAKMGLLSLGFQSEKTGFTVLMSLNYALSFAIFFGVLHQIFFYKPETTAPIHPPKVIQGLLLILSIALIILSFRWDFVLQIVSAFGILLKP